MCKINTELFEWCNIYIYCSCFSDVWSCCDTTSPLSLLLQLITLMYTNLLIYWHCWHSMWSRACVVVGCPSICLSVSSIDYSSTFRQVCCLADPWAGDIDRQRRAPSSNGATALQCTAAWWSSADVSSVMFTATIEHWTWTCIVLNFREWQPETVLWFYSSWNPPWAWVVSNWQWRERFVDVYCSLCHCFIRLLFVAWSWFD